VPARTGSSPAVKLVDYDGMWVPGLADRPAGEVGHPAYQHPQRLAEGTYRREVDHFPLLPIATALDCLRVGGLLLGLHTPSPDSPPLEDAVVSNVVPVGDQPNSREV
jgi:hypothetical protein